MSLYLDMITKQNNVKHYALLYTVGLGKFVLSVNNKKMFCHTEEIVCHVELSKSWCVSEGKKLVP